MTAEAVITLGDFMGDLMRTLRFHENGGPVDVLRLEDAEVPQPGPGQVRVAVRACGLTPADWALCGGLFGGDLPRGIGLEVAGTVDALGDGVTGVQAGDEVFGPVPFTGPTAGASDYAVLDIWFPRPEGLDPARAAALPMAVETAYRGLEQLGVRDGAGNGLTVLVHGAGTTVGFAAAQIAVQHGARVIATAGETYAGALQKIGAEVTAYGPGLAERVTALAHGPVDLVLDTAPPGPVPSDSVLPELVRTVRAPRDVYTLTHFATAGEFGVRFQFSEDADEIDAAKSGGLIRNDVLGEYGRLAGQGRFEVPVARVFALDDWREAAEISLSGHARGKLILQIGQ
jgi:NADPH:quinone reductase-like Zn-dependent oxidoreductase